MISKKKTRQINQLELKGEIKNNKTLTKGSKEPLRNHKNNDQFENINT
jgi:hypothetical protein